MQIKMKKQNVIQIARKTTLRVFMLAAIALVAIACEKDETEDVIVKDTTSINIIEVLEAYGDNSAEFDLGIKNDRNPKTTFKTLNVALARTGLAGTVSSERLTVFAPTDEAFAALGLNQQNIADVPNLREILLYHVVGGVVMSNQLSEVFVPTLNGAAVEIGLSSGVTVNDANVVIADIRARNGVIHAIDKVLFPPDKNLVELALSFDPEFSILVQALLAVQEEVDLIEVLSGDGPFTVFAPTNDAFVALIGELDGVDNLGDIPVDVLISVLTYHVVSGRVFSSDLVSGPVSTLNGDFTVNVENLTITDINFREANLIPSLLNVQATNGVVHVIDRVILPSL
jgi:uncharacterized surface protein with fasciclin (FAS1) repeats